MASPTAADFVRQAEQEIGVPYVYGGDSPSGFDCSGLVFWCLHQIGIASCPRTSEEQWNWCRHLGGENDLLAGDLILEEWSGDPDPPPGHVVIYVGDGQCVEAPHTGADVWKRPWSPNETTIVGYGRVPGLQMSPEPPPPVSSVASGRPLRPGLRQPGGLRRRHRQRAAREMVEPGPRLVRMDEPARLSNHAVTAQRSVLAAGGIPARCESGQSIHKAIMTLGQEDKSGTRR